MGISDSARPQMLSSHPFVVAPTLLPAVAASDLQSGNGKRRGKVSESLAVLGGCLNGGRLMGPALSTFQWLRSFGFLVVQPGSSLPLSGATFSSAVARLGDVKKITKANVWMWR